MEIKFSHNKILFIIIAVLVIYLLFFNNTSGYSSNDAYVQGYDDKIEGVYKNASFFKLRYSDKSGTLYSQYMSGWNTARDDQTLSARVPRDARATNLQISARKKIEQSRMRIRDRKIARDKAITDAIALLTKVETTRAEVARANSQASEAASKDLSAKRGVDIAEAARVVAVKAETTAAETARFEAAKASGVSMGSNFKLPTAYIGISSSRREAIRAEAIKTTARVEAARSEAIKTTAILAAARNKVNQTTATFKAAQAEVARVERDILSAAQAEVSRAAKAEADRAEAARVLAARTEADRVKAAQAEAAKAEYDRVLAARYEAFVAEAARLAAARAEADRAARAEAARAEAARAEAARGTTSFKVPAAYIGSSSYYRTI